MNLPITFFTIVKNGMPWMPMIYPALRALSCDWEWIIVEGTAAPTHCTRWCKPIPAGLSDDGTADYIDHLQHTDERIHVMRNIWWDGKVSMCNMALSRIRRKCLLWQIDADELWRSEQIESVRQKFNDDDSLGSAEFLCRYFVGPDLVTVGEDCYGNHTAYEWRRAWRFTPGLTFKTHEPPVMLGVPSGRLDHEQTKNMGCVFDHMAYASRVQAEFKQTYYGYPNAVESWDRLQHNLQWPTRLSEFLFWVKDDTMVTKL